MTTSNLDIISIDVLALEQIAQNNPMKSIDTALQSVSIAELSEKNTSLPTSLKSLLIWRKWEKRMCSKTMAGLVINLIYAPILFGGFALYSGLLLWFFIFALSLPFAGLAIFSLWARKKNWFAKKLAALRDDPFVILTENKLIENIPERSALLADAEALRLDIQASEDRTLKIDGLIMQIRKAASDLSDVDISNSIRSLEAEQKNQKELRERAMIIVRDIESAIIDIDNKRKEIHARARLEMLRNQVHAATEAENRAFAQESIASLTVDRVEFQYRLAGLQTDMANAALRWKTENDINA